MSTPTRSLDLYDDLDRELEQGPAARAWMEGSFRQMVRQFPSPGFAHLRGGFEDKLLCRTSIDLLSTEAICTMLLHLPPSPQGSVPYPRMAHVRGHCHRGTQMFSTLRVISLIAGGD